MTRIIGEAPKEERPLIPAGAYTLTLNGIKEVEVEDRYHPEGDGSFPVIKKLVWEFVSDKSDKATGKPYEHSVWTGLFYGNEKAKLTELLDWMLPEVDTKTKKRGFDVETLIGKKFKARIQHATSESGRTFAKLTMLDPIDEIPFDPDKVKAEIPL